MLNLTGLELRNFLNHSHTVLGKEYFEPKSYLITGANGVGKSALTEAILVCFTGKTFRGLRADEVIKEDVKKNCFVRTDFEKNGKEGFIEFGRKPDILRFHNCEEECLCSP